MDFRSSDAPSVSKISITLECCLIPLSYSVSFTSIAFPRAMSSLVYAIAIRLVQPSLYLYLRSLILLSYATDPVNPSLSYGFSPLPFVVRVISVSQVILSYPRSHPVAVHLRRRPLHPRHESQHPSLAGARPLERAYCHECVCVAITMWSPKIS